MLNPTHPPREISLTAVEGRGTVREVVAQLAGAIQHGELRLGDRLPVERAAAEQLGVSRTTVRKALSVLGEAGVLEVRSGKGRNSGTFVVSELVPRELIASPATVRFEEISDVLEARRGLEIDVALMAARYATDEDLAAMHEVVDEQVRADTDVARVRALDPTFHLSIARATHNDVSVALMQTLLERLELSRGVPMGGPEEARSTIAIHRETIAAIASRDPRRVVQTMRRHLSVMERTWEEVTGESLAPWPPDPRLT